jgi:hypothetical protein
MISNKRLSELSDILCLHICMRNTTKALLIAQYLRRVTGFHCSIKLNKDFGY